LTGRAMLAIAAVLSLALPAAGQVPSAPTIEVDARTAGDQVLPAVAVDRLSGQFVVVWASRARFVAVSDIVGRRFAADGNAVGGVFRVSAQPDNFRSIPLAADGAGGWVAAWENAKGYDISVRRHLFEGAAASSARTANATTAGIQSSPSVAADASGNFVVVWQDSGKDGDGYGVFGQRFDAAGERVGDEFQVNETAAGHQGSPSVAMDGSGNFVIAWVGAEIRSQRFDAAGQRVGAEVQVNETADGVQFAPKVALDGSGNALVIWQNRSGPRLVGRRFDTSGAPLGPERVLDARHGTDATVAGSAAGFVAVWLSSAANEAFAQRIGTDGELLGPAFSIDPATSQFARGPAVAMDDSGGFVVAWSGGPSQRGIFARRFTSATGKPPDEPASEAATTRAGDDAPALARPGLALAERETFDSAPLSGWTLPAGWVRTSAGEGFAIEVAAAEAGPSSVTERPRVFGDSAVTADFTFTGVSGTAQLVARDGEAGSYFAGLDAADLVTLERRDGEGAILASWTAPAPPQAIPGAARTLRLSAIGSALGVAVDDVEVLALDDESPLPPGRHKVGALFSEPVGALTFDNYATWVPSDGIDRDGSVADPVDVNAVPGRPVISTIAPGAPATPLANAARTNVLQPVVAWTPSGTDPVDYHIQVSTTLSFSSLVADTVVSEPTRYFQTPVLVGPPAGQKYFWRVRAQNANGFGPFSAVYNFTVDTQPPSAPPLVSPALNGVSTTLRPTFKWEAVSDAVRYRLLVASNFSCSTTVLEATNIATASFTPATNLPQGEYWYCVESTDAAGNASGFAEKRHFVVNLSLLPANGANVVAATAPYRPSVVLTWTNVSGATFDLDIATDSSFTDTVTQQVTGNRFTVTTLSFGTYYWRVGLPGNALPQSLARHFTITPPVPVAPGIQTAVPGSLRQGAFTNDTTPVFDWSVPANWATPLPGQSLYYELHLAADAGFSAPLAGSPLIFTNSDGEWTASTLPDTAATTYYWRVRAVTNLGVTGPFSITWRFTLDTVDPGLPASLTSPADGAVATAAKPPFSWAAGTGGASSYRLEIDDDPAFGSPVATPIVNATRYTPAAPLAQGVYSWRVFARDAAGNETDAPTGPRTLTVDYRTGPIEERVITTANPSGVPVTFTWIRAAGAPAGTTYTIEIDDDMNDVGDLTLPASTTTSSTSPALPPGDYQYRLIVSNLLGTSDWRTFHITAP
jgi:hypothetical protein